MSILEEQKPKRVQTQRKRGVRTLLKDVPLPPLFGKYDFKEVVIRDEGMKKYINIDPVISIHSEGRYGNKSFGKFRMNIIERLINNLMRTEEWTGKKHKAYTTVKKAFDIIHKKTNSNPIQVFITALENTAPREEITRLQYGGIRIPKAVDSAPYRRVNVALRNIVTGAMQASFKNPKNIENCLADEIILASRNDMGSFAIGKKEESERVSASAR